MKILKSVLLICFVLIQWSCSTSKKSTSSSNEINDTDSESEVSQDSKVQAPKKIEYQPVTLVFGPGLAKAFSYAGVLKALHQQKIPIKGIVATEFGALIAGIYATSRSINEFEWKLTKFRKKAFRRIKKDGEFLEQPSSDFYKALNEVLLGKRMESTRVKVAFGAFTTSRSKLSILNRGSMIQAVKAALGFPGFIASHSWEGRSSYSSAMIQPFLVDFAKENWDSPIIVISVTQPRVEYQYQVSQKEVDYQAVIAMAQMDAQKELEKAQLVIEPRLKDIRYYDFSKIHSIIFRGRQKVLSRISEIKSLLEVN